MFQRLGLATGLSREFKLRANDLANLGLLSCSATAVVTLQLLTYLACVQLLVACKPRATREIQSRVPSSLHNLEHFFTLSHTLPLHDSHLNKGLLIAKIQANLAQNKANKMVDKIQPYKNTKVILHDFMWKWLQIMDVPNWINATLINQIRYYILSFFLFLFILARLTTSVGGEPKSSSFPRENQVIPLYYKTIDLLVLFLNGLNSIAFT